MPSDSDLTPEESRRAFKRPKGRLVKWLLGGIGVVVLLWAASWWMQESTPSTTQQSPPPPALASDKKPAETVPEVQVVKPIRRDLVATLRIPATVSPFHQTTLYSKVPGFLKTVLVDKGDAVKAGQVLAVIDYPELQERYQQARTELAIKKVTYERLFNVWKENPDVIAKQEVDVAEAAYQGAKHALEQVATMLDYTKVRAPYNGFVTARFVDPGALIQAATSSATQAVPLFTIMDAAVLRFYVNVPQEDAPYIKKGTPATIEIKDAAGKTIEAAVTRSTLVLDPGTRTMLVEIDVPNPGLSLSPGMFAEVTLALRQQPKALVIPPAALISETNSKAIFVIDGGQAKKVPVKTGIDDGVWVEVVSGLKGDEDVVVVGKSRLADGMRVKASAYNLPAGKPGSQKY
jgi:RND family efflux transporter MFP subunit